MDTSSNLDETREVDHSVDRAMPGEHPAEDIGVADIANDQNMILVVNSGTVPGRQVVESNAGWTFRRPLAKVLATSVLDALVKEGLL